jgi:thiamine biosynthesis lipoprotein
VNEESVHTVALMGTVITIRIVGDDHQPDDHDRRHAASEDALKWFREVEQACSRFDSASELRALCRQPGEAVTVSPLLFEAVRFALAVADETDGAFDPTVGRRMNDRGYNRDYRHGTSMPPDFACDPTATFRDVQLDAKRQTITLRRPLLLDLGAAAKGLAIDLAAAALRSRGNFLIDAGGDLYAAGHNARDQAWTLGIRHPRREALIETVTLSDASLCTSGDYERGSHLLDPRTGEPANALASVSVVAPSALVADVLATAAFVLGPQAGRALLERHGVEGLLVTPELALHATSGWESLRSAPAPLLS